MRVVLLLLFISIGINSLAQENLSKQLQLIIKDTANHFRKINGPLKSYLLDSVFNSSLTIEGTRKNELQFTPYRAIYSADILDSASTETASKVFDLWVSKLIKAIGTSFQHKEGHAYGTLSNSRIKLYVFTCGGMSITLDHSLNLYNNKLHKVGLILSYTFPY